MALKLKRGLTTPRYIFISHQMQTRLATTLTMLREVASNNKQGPRRWRWFQDDDDSLTRFRTKAEKLGKAHQSKVVSLLTHADALNNRHRNLPHKMRLRELLEGSYRVDPFFSRLHLPAIAPLSQGRLAKDEPRSCFASKAGLAMSCRHDSEGVSLLSSGTASCLCLTH